MKALVFPILLISVSAAANTADYRCVGYLRGAGQNYQTVARQDLRLELNRPQSLESGEGWDRLPGPKSIELVEKAGSLKNQKERYGIRFKVVDIGLAVETDAGSTLRVSMNNGKAVVICEPKTEIILVERAACQALMAEVTRRGQPYFWAKLYAENADAVCANEATEADRPACIEKLQLKEQELGRALSEAKAALSAAGC